MSTALTASQKRHLRSLAHVLKPVILVGGLLCITAKICAKAEDHDHQQR